MSSFLCEKCNKAIIDTPTGYIIGCEHYPIEKEVTTAKVMEVVDTFHKEKSQAWLKDAPTRKVEGKPMKIMVCKYKFYPREKIKNGVFVPCGNPMCSHPQWMFVGVRCTKKKCPCEKSRKEKQ